MARFARVEIALAGGLPRIGTAGVYAVDANANFARPGPRVSEGAELLASMFHPKLLGPPDSEPALRVAWLAASARVTLAAGPVSP